MRHAWAAVLVILLCAATAATAGAAPNDAPKKEADKDAAQEPAKETPAPSKTEPTGEPTQETEADKLEKQLLATAAEGKLTDDLVALFKTYSLARAKEKLANDVPEDFWMWLDANQTIREGLLVALHPAYNGEIVKCLEELRGKFGKKVDSHPHLALAFAVVFGRADDQSPWGPYVTYLRKDREAPTMEQSFAYYLKHERGMQFSLTNTPWPLLAFVADNETPLRERLWVLANFGRQAGKGVYYKVPYDWDKLRGEADIGERPRTLPNIRKYGGVCSDRAYFASRVYKSLGIPSMSVEGEGRRGGHAWVAWIVPRGKSYDLTDVGRFDNDRYYTGSTWCPLERKRVLDRDVQLLAAAMGGYDEYLKACIGCHVYGMFDGEARRGKTQLLKDGLEHNPFFAPAWRLLADASVEGISSPEEGEKLFDTIFKALESYPDLTYEVLEKILSPRLDAKGEQDKDKIERNLLVLSRAFHLYEKDKRPDLAVKLCLLQGGYLEAVERQKTALKLYVTGSQTYAKQHYGFRELFDRALRMLDGKENLRKRLAFCEMMVKEVPRQRSDFDKKLDQLNPSYVYVVRAYVRALLAAGQDNLAERWEARITPKNRD